MFTFLQKSYRHGLQFQLVTRFSRNNKQFFNLVLSMNYSESYYFAHIILKQASQFYLQENYFGLSLN